MKNTLEEIVGADHIFDDPEILESYSKAKSSLEVVEIQNEYIS